MPQRNKTPLYANNFDFLRILFAVFVVVSHSIALSGLSTPNPVLNRFLSGLSETGVFGFFVISGFLVSQSLDRSTTVSGFLHKRFRRIFPGLFAMSLLVCFVLGSIFSLVHLQAYFGDSSTYLTFFSTTLLIPLHKCLPGLFENNFAGCAINGSLWTIRYEILLYLILSTLFFILPAKRKKVSIIIGLSLLILAIGWEFFLSARLFGRINHHVGNLVHLSYLFFVGVFFNYFKLISAKNSKKIFLIVLTAIIICKAASPNLSITYLFLPPLIISAGLSYSRFIQIDPKFGDISYGLYIYAYPIQQILVATGFISNLFMFILISFLLASLSGYLSWHLVEKRFLKRRPGIAGRISVTSSSNQHKTRID